MFALAIGATTSAHAVGFRDLSIVVKNSNRNAKAVLITSGRDASKICSALVDPSYEGGYSNGPMLNTETWYSVVAMSTPNCADGTGMSGLYNIFKLATANDPSESRQLEIYIADKITFKDDW